MESGKVIQGRCITGADVKWTRDLLVQHSDWNRCRLSRELCERWMDKYGHPVHLAETFVERDRFWGACYRAAGWQHTGATTRRSRNDVHQTLSVPVKDVLVYPLHRAFRGRLCV